MITLPRATLRSIMATSEGEFQPRQVDLLRQAGYEGGREVAGAFERHVRNTGEAAPEDLPLEQFNAQVAEFFAESNWGNVSISSLHDLVAAVDIADCWEARMHGSASAPCCHVSTGLLAAFFSHFAPYLLGTLEVECAAAGHDRCRFVLGPPDVLNALYQRMMHGETYAAALAQISEVSASA